MFKRIHNYSFGDLFKQRPILWTQTTFHGFYLNFLKTKKCTLRGILNNNCSVLLSMCCLLFGQVGITFVSCFTCLRQTRKEKFLKSFSIGQMMLTYFVRKTIWRKEKQRKFFSVFFSVSFCLNKEEEISKAWKKRFFLFIHWPSASAGRLFVFCFSRQLLYCFLRSSLLGAIVGMRWIYWM